MRLFFSSLAIFGTPGYTGSLSGVESLIESTGTKANVHLIGAIHYQTGKPNTLMFEGKVNEEVLICFVKTLLKEIRKPIHLILDNASYHPSAYVNAFLRTVSKKITVHSLPPYSPDYNPIEGLWKKLKKQTTPHRYFQTLDPLKKELIQGLQWMRHHLNEVLSLCGFYQQLA